MGGVGVMGVGREPTELKLTNRPSSTGLCPICVSNEPLNPIPASTHARHFPLNPIPSRRPARHHPPPYKPSCHPPF